MERRDAAVGATSEGAPEHCAALRGHTAQGNRRAAAANWHPTNNARPEGGRRERGGELMLLGAEPGARRGRHSKACVRQPPRRGAARPARMWGRAQTSCSGKQPSSAGGRKGNSQLGAGRRKAVSWESRRRLDCMSRERVRTKLPPSEKVREHENVALIR